MKSVLVFFLLLALVTCQGQVVDSTSSFSARGWQDTTLTFTTVKIVSAPCPIDTLKGILIWHSSSEVNGGDSWDYGYWIGKCGPVGYMPMKDLTFVPGVLRITQLLKNRGEKNWYKKEVEYVNKGFRDAKFRPISGRRVYAFIIIRKP